MRRILVVTGSRAEYGLLKPLLARLDRDKNIDMHLAVTGSHWSSELGNTYREIESDGFSIDTRVDMLLSSDTPAAVAKSMGLGLIGFGDVIERVRPDLMVVLGDRFEILAVAAAALVASVPIAHIHGGEVTEGAVDESIRHAVSKMSHLHFVAAEEYQRRVIQLGEQPERVFLVGALGLDGVTDTPLISRADLEADLGLRFREQNVLVTFHPATLEDADAGDQMRELLAALNGLGDVGIVLTLPNADVGGRRIIPLIEQFVATHTNAYMFKSLGSRRYLSALAVVDAVIGNSSSGLIEVPAFKKGTVNIGDRQRGRLRARSVIDVAPNRHAIATGIRAALSPEFRSGLVDLENPYGDGGASKRIHDVMASVPLDGLLRKPFWDLPQADSHDN